jgi:hypothetical protein
MTSGRDVIGKMARTARSRVFLAPKKTVGFSAIFRFVNHFHSARVNGWVHSIYKYIYIERERDRCPK